MPSDPPKEQRSFYDIRQIYRSKTEPITCDDRFNGSFKDDNYYRTFIEDAIRTEQEVFYAEEKNERKNDKRAVSFQEKLDKILVGISLIWDEDKYDTLFPKMEYLIEAKADINTTWGAGIFSKPLIKRVFYTSHFKLRRALIDVADEESLKPRKGQSLFSLACDRTDFKTMEILLKKNCEPNRIQENGTTPLMALCRDWTHREEDIGHVEQLKCIKLLTTFEGPDARKLKTKYANDWAATFPNIIGKAWKEVADFVIPNVNVLPTCRGKTAKELLKSWKNDQDFITEVMALLGDLFKDARSHKPYWPSDREEYKKMFDSNWE